MATYPGYVWDGSAWQPIGSQVADMSPFALATGSNIAGFGAWSDFAPNFTWANTSLTFGTPTARYTLMGKVCHFYFKVLCTGGSYGSPSASPSFVLPVGARSSTGDCLNLTVRFVDSGNGWYGGGWGAIGSTISLGPVLTNGWFGNWTSTVPFVWSSGDGMYVSGTYEAA